MVEEALRHAITRHLVPTRVAESGPILFEEENAPLTGLASRTRMAYALGIIGEEERSDLTFIRGIRNAFAHSTDRLSFEHETILASLDALHVLEKMPGEDDLKKIAGREFHAMRYAAAIAVHCGMLETASPLLGAGLEPFAGQGAAEAMRRTAWRSTGPAGGLIACQASPLVSWQPPRFLQNCSGVSRSSRQQHRN